MVEASKLTEHAASVFQVIEMKALVAQRTYFVFEQDVDKHVVGWSVAGTPVQGFQNVQFHVLELVAGVLVAAKVLQRA